MSDSKSKVKIFISHSVAQDGDLAEMLRDKLRILGGPDYVRVFISKDIAGGKEWHTEIKNNLKDTDVLIVLYTSKQQDLNWLIYEAAFFQGVGEDDGKPVVCIKNPDLDEPPSQIKPLQSYDGNSNGIQKFLVDLLLSGDLTNKTIINKDLNNDDLHRDNLIQAVDSLQNLFSQRRKSVDYFPQRLEIILQEGCGSAKTDLLTRAQIQANEATRVLLNLSLDAKLDWGAVYTQLKGRGHKWVDDVVESVESIKNDLRPCQMMEPFESRFSGKCYPLLARVERKKSIPISMTIIFAEEGEDVTEHTEIKGEPEHFQTLSGMLNMARRFRWTVVEQHLDKLKLNSDPDVIDQARQFLSSLRVLEEEADKKGWMSPAKVRASFPESASLIDEIFATYGAEKQLLLDSVNVSNEEGVIKSLSSFQAINKRFFLIGLQRFRDLVEYTLEPVGVLPTGEFRRRVDDDPIWERLQGAWTGKAGDIKIPRRLKYKQQLEFELHLDFRLEAGRVKPMMTVKFNIPGLNRGPIKTLCEPVHVSESFFSIKYGLDDKKNTHYGVTMLHIDPEGQKIEGFYLSRKLFEPNTVGFGYIDLTRDEV